MVKQSDPPIYKKLKTFDLKSIKDNSTVVLIGRRGTGKSTIVKNILSNFEHVECGAVFSPTEGANQFYKEMVPESVIYNKTSERKFAQIQEMQMQQVKDYKEGKRASKPTLFIVMDDCLYKDDWKRHEFIRWIFMNGRHYHILFILTIQDCLGIPPELRSNIDYTFVLKENFIGNRKRVFEHYAGATQYFKTFQHYMDKYTKNRGCLIIDSQSQSTKITKNIYSFCADPNVPTPYLCSPLRQYVEQNQQSEYNITRKRFKELK